jgi:predicted MFS family arabinose efflux permease
MIDHTQPDSSYSWFRLAVSVALATTAGVGLWAGAVILPVIEKEFSVDRSGASLPYTIIMICFAVGGLIMGRLATRFGIMVPMLLGSVLLGIGFVAAAVSPSYWFFIAANAGLIGLFGVATSFGPLVADISLWFQKYRGLAVSLVASGNYLAGAIWSPILTMAVDTYGWRNTYIGIGILCTLIMVPLSLLLKRRASLEDRPGPAAVTSRLNGTNGLHALLMLAGLSCCVAMSMPQVHIVAYCGDLGFSSAAGANMLSLMLLFGVISRIVSGYLSDKIGGLATLIAGSTLQLLALILYIPFDGLTSLYVVSAVFGLAQGGIVPSYAMIIRDYFPAREAGSRITMVLTCTVLGMALGGWLSGEIFDYTGSYTAAFLHGAAWNMLNLAIAFWLLSNRSRPQSAQLSQA